jgi:hypothetical protein
MSTSASGTTYTYVSGSTTNIGGAGNRKGGGRAILTFTSTSAVVGIGTVITIAKSNVPKNILFMLSPPSRVA